MVEYVKDVTNKNSKNFIPIEDRIATFDMDGTFLCETTPSYFEHMLYIHRVIYDDDFTPTFEDRSFGIELEKIVYHKNYQIKLGSSAPHKASVFEGMDYSEYKSYVENFMKTSVDGLSNLQWGEAFYLPMVEVIKYLQANDFQVYVVSGADRDTVRILCCDMLKIPTNNVIGTDIELLATNQGNKDGLHYDYTKDDKLVRGGFVIKNVQLNKVKAIAKEIGKQPVLAFGNSTGDTSMLNYAIYGNKYKSEAFLVLCDDTERELGDISKAKKCEELAEENGWNTISMHDDWKTIYGDNVRREND